MRLTLLIVIIISISIKAIGQEFCVKSSNLLDSLEARCFSDTLSAKSTLNQYINDLRTSGYFDLTYTLVIHDSTINFNLVKGSKYEISNAIFDSSMVQFLEQTGLRIGAYSPNDALAHLSENGYPLAQIEIKKLYQKDSIITPVYELDPDQLFFFDTLTIMGDRVLDPKFLEQYLRLKEGEVFNFKRLQKSKALINQLPFVEQYANTGIALHDNRISPVLILQKQRANTFDAIVGFFPASDETDQILFTGELKLDLNNLFQRGIRLQVDWQKVQQRTQELQLGVDYPYVFNLPLGTSFEANLLRYDNLFTRNRVQASIAYLFSGMNKLDLFVASETGRVIAEGEPDTLASESNLIDYNQFSYGLELQWNNLDRVRIPRNGWSLNGRFAFGSKQIIENPAWNPEIYETISSPSVVGNFKFKLARFQRISEKSVFLLDARAESILDDNIFLGQVIRIGGIHSLRGFDDMSILSTSYGLLNLEYRFLPDDDSYLSIFANAAYTELNLSNSFSSDLPVGFGLGYTFTVKAGVFSLNYAFGSAKDLPLDFSRGKIHFGFNNTF